MLRLCSHDQHREDARASCSPRLSIWIGAGKSAPHIEISCTSKLTWMPRALLPGQHHLSALAPGTSQGGPSSSQHLHNRMYANAKPRSAAYQHNARRWSARHTSTVCCRRKHLFRERGNRGAGPLAICRNNGYTPAVCAFRDDCAWCRLQPALRRFAKRRWSCSESGDRPHGQMFT